LIDRVIAGTGNIDTANPKDGFLLFELTLHDGTIIVLPLCGGLSSAM